MGSIWRARMRRPLCWALALLLLAGCGDTTRTLWHEQKLPSGRSVKITQMVLAWGGEHDRRIAAEDCFALEFVSSRPGADTAEREAEALEVFELVRPLSEQWGFRIASVAGFPTLDRRGRYDLYAFERGADGRWTFRRTEMKVFRND